MRKLVKISSSLIKKGNTESLIEQMIQEEKGKVSKQNRSIFHD
jgi:hypothetical protein